MAIAETARSHCRDRSALSLTPNLRRPYSPLPVPKGFSACVGGARRFRASHRNGASHDQFGTLAHSIATTIVGEKSCLISMAS